MHSFYALFGFFSLVFLVFGFVVKFLVLPETGQGSNIVWVQFIAALVFFILWLLAGGVRNTLRDFSLRGLMSHIKVILISFLFISFLVAINYLSATKNSYTYDATESGVNSLSAQAFDVFKKLDKPVLIRFIKSPVVNAKDEKEENLYFSEIALLEKIQSASPKVKVQQIDPQTDIALVKELRVTEDGTTFISYQGEPTSKRWVSFTGDLTEQKLVNALRRLIDFKNLKLYVIEGEEEGNIEREFSLLASAIRGERVDLIPWNLSVDGKVPTDADGIIIIAPQKNFSELSKKRLSNYLSCGSAIVMVEPFAHENNLAEILRPLGFEIPQAVVVSRNKEYSEALKRIRFEMPVAIYQEHKITEVFQKRAVFATVSAVLPIKGSAVETLAYADESTWLETNLKELLLEVPSGIREENEMPGPIPIIGLRDGSGLMSAKDVTCSFGNSKGKKNRIAVFGDSDFVAYRNISLAYNRDLFLNVMNWVLGHDGDITIRPRSYRETLEPISEDSFRKLFVSTAVVFPQFLICLGLAIWFLRLKF